VGITPATNLWGNATEMKKFDLAIFSCECSEYPSNKTNPQAVQQYVDGGGRLFASHYHYTWFKNLIPAWTPTASWTGAYTSTPDLIDTSFPKGKALADWLKYVEPSLTYGEMPLNEKTYNAGLVNPPTTRWVYSNTGGNATHYLSFNTPVGAMPDNQCGKAVYGGMHISAGGGSVTSSFPNGCTTTLSPQEKALAFLFFDLSSCIQKDTDPPKPPIPN
jgi:hypothetical protein